MPLRPAYSTPFLAALNADRPAAGEYVPDRDAWLAATASTITTGQIAFTFFTADKSEAINNVRVTTGTTAAGATPTLCRMGIYSVNAAGDLTALLAATANDTTLFAAAGTSYTRALTTQFDKVAGQRYATALIVVSGAAIPNFQGSAPVASLAPQYVQGFELPARSSRMIGQTDLGSSYTRAQQAAWPSRIGFTLS